MSNDWYVKINNAEHGPLSSERLKQLALEGKVKPKTFVRKGDSGTWLKASHVTGLFPPAASAGTPATAVPPSKPNSPPSVPTATPRSAVPAVPPPAMPSARPAGPWRSAPTALSNQLRKDADDAFAEIIGEKVLQTAPPSTGNTRPQEPRTSTPTATSTPASPPVAEKKDNLVRNAGIAAGAIAVVIIALLVVPDLFRDKWELNNAHRVLAKLKEADGLQKSDPVAAHKIYDDVLKEAKQHKTTDLLSSELASAEKAMTALYAKVQDKSRAQEAEKRRAAEDEARPANEEKPRISAPSGYVIRMFGESQEPYLDDVNVPLTWTTTKSLAHRFPTKEEAERFVTQLRKTLAIAHAQRQLPSISGFGVESADSDSNSTGGGSNLAGWGGWCCCIGPMLGIVMGIWVAIQRGKRLRNCPACAKEVSRLAKVCPHCGHPLQ